MINDDNEIKRGEVPANESIDEYRNLRKNISSKKINELLIFLARSEENQELVFSYRQTNF